MWPSELQDYNVFSFIVNNEKSELKHVLLDEMNVSIRMICNLKREGEIFLNNKKAKLHDKVIKGDLVTLKLKEYENEYIAQKYNLDIMYEDHDLLLVNKESNMVVHPTKSHQENTLLNYAKFYFQQNKIKSKVRFVNRLDKDTSGLLLIAKNQYSHSILARKNALWEMEKIYTAIVSGILPIKKGTINAPIGKINEGDIRRFVTPLGQHSITHYKVLEEFNNISLVEIKLETGRTHQIRTHFSYIGHPLLGDELYGGDCRLINRQALHSTKITFQSPRGKNVTISSNPPEDMRRLLSRTLKQINI